MTTSFYYEGKFGPIKPAKTPHFLLVCLYVEREVSGHVFVC